MLKLFANFSESRCVCSDLAAIEIQGPDPALANLLLPHLHLLRGKGHIRSDGEGGNLER